LLPPQVIFLGTCISPLTGDSRGSEMGETATSSSPWESDIRLAGSRGSPTTSSGQTFFRESARSASQTQGHHPANRYVPSGESMRLFLQLTLHQRAKCYLHHVILLSTLCCRRRCLGFGRNASVFIAMMFGLASPQYRSLLCTRVTYVFQLSTCHDVCPKITRLFTSSCADCS
jgi:hypothetical protein